MKKLLIPITAFGMFSGIQSCSSYSCNCECVAGSYESYSSTVSADGSGAAKDKCQSKADNSGNNACTEWACYVQSK